MSGCPTWCCAPHNDGERRHLADMRAVTALLDSLPEHVPMLFTDLRQGEDGQAVVHLDRDQSPVARLHPKEAAKLGWDLIALAWLAGEL